LKDYRFRPLGEPIPPFAVRIIHWHLPRLPILQFGFCAVVPGRHPFIKTNNKESQLLLVA
jgi:hypothetical protein